MSDKSMQTAAERERLSATQKNIGTFATTCRNQKVELKRQAE
jgi:hypothetical protein